MTEEELKRLQDDHKYLQDEFKHLQDEYKILKEANEGLIKTNEENILKINKLNIDKKEAEDRYTDLFKQTILVTNKEKEQHDDEEFVRVEDLYIV